jgi:hypothetical protein
MATSPVTPKPVSVSVSAPYEALGIKLIELIMRVIDGQPAEVRAELWKMYVEDLRAWREFWQRFAPK